MGSQAGNSHVQPDETPRHLAQISKPLPLVLMNYLRAMGLFVAEAEDYSYIPDDMGWGKGRRTVTNVAWSDAKAATCG